MSSPPQKPGTISADALVAALKQGNPPAYAVPVRTLAQLPPALATLHASIQNNGGSSVSQLLLALVRPAAVLRKTFVLKPPAPQGKADRQQTVFRNLANGSGEYAFDLPSLNLCGFMASLFQAIASGYQQIEFNERDLFHGHILPNEASRDVVIIFHAKEWPSEEVPQGKRNMWGDLNLLTKIHDFDLDSPVMTQRNFIWTLSTNTIYLLTDPQRNTPSKADPNYAKMILPVTNSALTVDDRKAGTIQEIYFGTELVSVNYFPTHLTGGDDEQIFFTPHAGGGWGPLLYLESLFPKIDPTVIAMHYQQTGTSLETTKDILSKL